MKSPKFLAYQHGQLTARTYILDVAIVNQLHQQQHVREELALRMLHNFLSAFGGAVQLAFHGLTSHEWGRLARQRETVVQVWQVVGDNEHGIAELEELAQPFELFG